ncbi:hypothetical protein SAMN05216386_2972 [Nitrosospira briensis]|uniref:Uncharacterized protein n=1 Tax=Nitrosospira briensis TaxID=35799 RepID=A0A1I5FDK4_9PROT|nr:hypothetical protein [Nitrosospira briensis]SFO21713.1 hypothetical protein SAMN05216386_2972 [Nitrosospira briensis]
MAGLKKPVDWEAIQNDYRAGIKSLRIMASEYGISHVSIKKRADKEGWSKDLVAKIKVATQARLNRAMVNSMVNTERQISEKTLVEVAAETQKNVILNHRRVISRIRAIFLSLLAELETLTNHKHLLEELGEVMNKGDLDQDRLNQLYNQVIELPMRVAAAKKLVDILKTLVSLEREAFGIEGKTDEVDPPVNSNITISFVSASGGRTLPSDLLHMN